jgi:site-specific DNA-methyltransferase (adenine-specific)
LTKIELNHIYNGDSNKLIKIIEDNSIDLIIIDPPYKIRKKTDEFNSLAKAVKKCNEELQRDNLINEYDKSILEELVRVMKKINIYIWCNGEQIPAYIDFFVNKYKCKMDILVWNKTNAMPLFNNKYLTDKEYCLYFRKGGYCNPSNYEDAKTVFQLPINFKDKKKWIHPTIKPISIIRTIIRNSSKEGDIVLDCFLGSGTTAVACILENRNYIGIEINKKYYDIAIERINETKESDS